MGCFPFAEGNLVGNRGVGERLSELMAQQQQQQQGGGQISPTLTTSSFDTEVEAGSASVSVSRSGSVSGSTNSSFTDFSLDLELEDELFCITSRPRLAPLTIANTGASNTTEKHFAISPLSGISGKENIWAIGGGGSAGTGCGASVSAGWPKFTNAVSMTAGVW